MPKKTAGGFDDEEARKEDTNALFNEFHQDEPPADLEHLETLKKGPQTDKILLRRLRDMMQDRDDLEEGPSV